MTFLIRFSEPAPDRVLVVHISEGDLPSFVERDVTILRSCFTVATIPFRGTPTVFQLAKAMARADVVVCWFAWDNAFWSTTIARVLGRRVITIAGGFDVVSLPEIGYGGLLSSGTARRTRMALRRASVVLAVSESTKRDAQRISERDDIRVVYHGFDERLYPLGKDKQDLVLTVGEVTDSNLRRKGLETFVGAARRLPNVPFVVAGRVQPSVIERFGDLPRNVSFVGWLQNHDLVELMMRAKVYVQVSAHEGFGCALAEAMLCGCVPVVTDRGALPEVVGDTGLYVPYGDAKRVSDAVAGALAMGESAGSRARNRIADRFPIRNRSKALIETVREVSGR